MDKLECLLRTGTTRSPVWLNDDTIAFIRAMSMNRFTCWKKAAVSPGILPVSRSPVISWVVWLRMGKPCLTPATAARRKPLISGPAM